MFFIGISAHIFIYLLVPALIIVYFYFKGIPAQSEAVESLSDKVICITAVSPVSLEDAYYFNKAVRRKESFDRLVQFIENIPVRFFCNLLFYYTSPALCYNGLRAPPVL